jgi:hypothetical protein
VARWYCPAGHCTFSLLPDCLSARLSGTLDVLEGLVRAAEQAPSLEALCAEQRLDIELPGALRWIRRRVQDVHSALHRIKGLLGEAFARVEPTLTAFAAHLGVRAVLVALRGIAAAWGWASCPSRSDSRPGAAGAAGRDSPSNTVRGLTRRDCWRRVCGAGNPPA